MFRSYPDIRSRSAAGWLYCALATAGLGVSSLSWADTSTTPSKELEGAAAPPLTVNATTIPTSETIRERYPNGRVKIEREVTLDAAGNYVNHGAWRMWDSAGKMTAEGRYDMGRRVGVWKRTHARDNAPVLNEPPFNKFTAPFTSQATFVAGQLEGDWVVSDADGRQCSRITLVHGKRHGKAMLWQPDGQVYREAAYQRGVVNGDVMARDASGQLRTEATYVDGHQLVNKVTHFPESEIKQSEGSFLTALGTRASPDDFWQFRFAEYSSRDEDERHGPLKMWHANGQLKLEGRFQFGHEAGKFVWWHANGQKAVEGEFVDGQQDGRWVWWHANGQKASQGEYHYGALVDTWRQWDADGRLTQTKEYRNDQVAARPVEVAVPAVETH